LGHRRRHPTDLRRRRRRRQLQLRPMDQCLTCSTGL